MTTASEMGKKGGASKSEKKRKAARENIKKAIAKSPANKKRKILDKETIV